jgi:HK97 family phage major capsid protein
MTGTTKDQNDGIADILRDKDIASLANDSTPDELRGKSADELVQYVEVLDAHLRALHETDAGELRDKTPVERKAFDYGLKVRDLAMKRIEEHRNISAIFRNKPKSVEHTLANLRYGADDPLSDVRRLSNPEARDQALRVLDSRDASGHMSDAAKTEVERQLRRDTVIARRILVTENDDYRAAWMKLLTQTTPLLTPEETRAVQAFQEFRAMSEGTTTAGGFGVPVFIDPSIILTAQETDNPFLTLARQVTVNTNKWKGVSSAGVTWSFDNEAAAVSDDSPTLAQPAVDVFMARGFIPWSIEIGMDYPAFAEEMSNLLSAGYDELLLDKFTRGSGSGEPRGLVTALDANTNVEVLLATAGTLAAADMYNVWAALPQKYRRRASWLSAVEINNKIRQLGTANNFHATTVDLKAEWADVFFNKGAYESPYMTDLTSNGVHTNLAVVGDFSNYVIARNGGMSVELVPHLFDVTNNRPTGQRGWFGYARIGGDSVNDRGFRLLNQT